MQAEPKQKKSLFSQRIKQARLNQQQQHDPNSVETSFPKALNINLVPDQSAQQRHQSQMKDQICRAQEKRFVDRILGSVLKEEEMKKIQSENMESIANMDKEEVMRYQEMLRKQLPSQFLSKFKKGSPQTKHQDIERLIDKSVGTQREKEQMKDENSEQKAVSDKSDSQDEVKEKQESLGSLSPILLNIESHELSYNHLNELNFTSSSVVSIRQLKQMVQNENNQTQIIGARLIEKLCQALLGAHNSKKSIPIFYLSNQYFHLVVLACDVYRYLIRSLIHQIFRTNFKSCWVEMIDALGSCIQVMCTWLRRAKEGTKMIESTSEFIKSQLEKKQNFLAEDKHEANRRTGVSVRKKLQETLLCLSQPMFAYSQAQIRELAACAKQVVDLLIIEELQCLVHKPDYRFHTLLQHIASVSSTLPRKPPRHELVASIVYPIALELMLREYRTNKMDREVIALKQIVYQWLVQQLGPTLLDLSNVRQNMSQTEQACLFRDLHIVKILAPLSYATLLANKEDQTEGSSPLAIMTSNELLANLLTLLNVEQYFSQTATICSSSQKQSEIANVEHMLSFLTVKLSHPTCLYLKYICASLLVDLMVIFLNYLDMPSNTQGTPLALTYHDLNEKILNSVLATLANVIVSEQQEARLWSMISQERMKALIQSYNYNSFGNHCFTRLLAFLAATSAPQTQLMIFEEVIVRYPFLFCYAAEGELYGPLSIYLRGSVTSEMERVYGMMSFNNKFGHNNPFVRYLIKK